MDVLIAILLVGVLISLVVILILVEVSIHHYHGPLISIAETQQDEETK